MDIDPLVKEPSSESGDEMDGQELEEMGDYSLNTEKFDDEELGDEYYEEYDEDLQADVDRLYCGENEDEQDADDSQMSIRVDSVYSQAGLDSGLQFDVEEVDEDYNGDGDDEILFEEVDQFDEDIVEPEDIKLDTESTSSLSVEFSNKLKSMKETVEYDRIIRSGSNSRENSRSSGSNEAMQNALRYLQQLAKEQCMLEESINDADDHNKEGFSTDNNSESAATDEGEFKKPSPQLVTAFSDQIRKFKENELDPEKQNLVRPGPEPESDVEQELPSYVQEMIEKDESLKRLLKTGSVTISQINESSPPSSPSSLSSTVQLPARSVTCTPVLPQLKNFSNTKGNLPGSVILSPSSGNSVLTSSTIFKSNTDWSQFPSAHKLLQMAALAEENGKNQNEIKLNVGKHFTALPGGSSKGTAGQSLISGNETVGTSSKLFNHIQAPQPKPSTSTSAGARGFSLPRLASKPGSLIPSSATSYLQQLASANKIRNQDPGPSLVNVKPRAALQNGSGSILTTKLPLKRIISEMLDKDIDDQVPTSSKNFRKGREPELDEGPPDEFDPMRFLEVSLQEDAGDEYYDDEELEVYPTYEPEIVPPKTTGGKQRELLPDDDARRKYICPHCLKGFCWSTDLKRHILTHTGERPFSCPHCSANFTRKFLMQKHVKKYHGPGAALDHPASTQLVRTAPNSLLKSNQAVRHFIPQQSNGKLSNHEITSSVKVMNGARVMANGGGRNGYIEHNTKIGKSASPTTHQQYYKYDPTQNINHIIKSNPSNTKSRRNSTNSSNQIIIKPKHMQPEYDEVEDEYEEEDMMYDEDYVEMDMDYGLSAGSNNSSNDAEDDEDVNFPSQPNDPIVINISSRNGGTGGIATVSKSAVSNFGNLKVEPRRINQSLVKQLIRANAKIKIAGGTNATPPSSSSRSFLNGNNGTNNNNNTDKDSNVMPPPSFTPSSSTIPRLKR